jgi:hypothetical protein
MQVTGRSNPKQFNSKARGIGQGEASNRQNKKLKLGGGQAYDRSAGQLQFQSK